jgi:uncharacterized protein (DUF433 family)
MKHGNRISIDPDAMLGKPTIKGTRVTVELILQNLSEGATAADILEAYPHLHHEDVLAALSCGADVVPHEELAIG